MLTASILRSNLSIAIVAMTTPTLEKSSINTTTINTSSLCSSCVYPSLYAVWSKWAPKNNKSALVTVSFSGAYFGTFIIMLLGGVIAADWSLKWIFYLSGISDLVWAVVWFRTTIESPATRQNILVEEVLYIEEGMGKTISQKDTVPWKVIFTSLPVWSIIAAQFGVHWSIYSIFSELPTFLVESLDFPVDTAGLLAVLPWLLLAISVYLTGIISDKLVEKYPILYVRKLIMAIYNDDRALIVIGACGPAWASFGVNHLDIGGHYAAVLTGMSNCIGSTPAALMFYTFFAAGELQSWASNSSDEHQRVLNNHVVSQDTSEHTTN
ncbi:unnamed protein product [Rotaria magnacalcarata]|uniref:Uncharacterized protein n=2 Tax=Rotaria magnacalcarata TaxID=392030 RepID=A0A815MME7_9BILA|nr:unnamed protein product [Rotaria magnacalcarata]